MASKVGKLLQSIFHPEEYYGFSSEHDQKMLRKARNRRYYLRHRNDLCEKRREKYRWSGE